MKFRNTIAVNLLLALASCFALGQGFVQRDSQTAASGSALTFQNLRGASAQTFEYVISGTPTTASIVAQGCMAGGTCSTLETSVTTANTIRTFGTAFDYYKVTPTFTGGTSPKLLVNINFQYTGDPSNSLVVADPCLGASAVKQSAVISFSTATTAALVAPVAGQKVYVCAFSVAMSSGTTPTLLFITGTGATCGTSTASLTGVMALPTTSGSFLTVGAGHTTFSSIASGGICITTAGTTPTGNGWITYVQQ